MQVLCFVYLSLALVLRARVWIRGLWFGGSYRQREEALSHDDGSGKSCTFVQKWILRHGFQALKIVPVV